jgi:hypothetical protein
MYNQVINNVKFVEEQRVQANIGYNPVIWNSLTNKRQIAIDPSMEQEAHAKVSKLTMNELNNTPDVLTNASTVIKQASFGVEVREVNYLLKHIELVASNSQDKAEALAMLSTKLLKNFDLSMILGSTNSLVSDDNSVVLSPSTAITSGSTLLDACLEAQSNIQNKLDSNSVLNVYMSVKYKKFYQDLIKGAITSFEFGEFSRFGLNPVFLVNSVSDRLVIADESANPEYVAADLLAQAEHGIDSQAVLVSNSQRIINETILELERQLPLLPRAEISAKAIANSYAIYCADLTEAMVYSNIYAPEHLILATDLWDEISPKIINAGSVFLGHLSPESAGDYASGTNHTLPTSSYARAYSGVSVDSFIKKITFQHISKEGIKNLGPAVEILAALEGLEAHKNAVSVRLKNN